ncbi:hypothetical protein MBLNU459_g6357t5 [Dothideomycetes sp. NU459]
MRFSLEKISVLALALTSSISQTAALPTFNPGWPPQSGPSVFSNASWPLPHNITGVSQPGANDTTQGWGGIHVHDPSVILGPDGHYYSFSTHGLIAISRASQPYSLDGYWETIGSVLKGESVIVNSGRTDPWAPDVHRVGNTYYCYYAVSQFGSQISAVGVATSPNLLPGTWTDHGTVVASSPTAQAPLNYTNAIDPNLFIDPKTGTPYLNYGSFWADIYQFVLEKDLMQVTYSPPPVQLSFDPVPPQAEEGSFMSYNDGWYYLWYSHGQCCGFNASALPAPGLEYSIRVGRSNSPRGPFVDMNGVDLTAGGGYIVYGTHDYVYAPGGEGVLRDYYGRDVLYYHYINIYYDPSYADDLKLLGWDFIDYINGWPVLSYY